MGTQKKAIVLKNSKNCMFEAAYFILKDDIPPVNESDMVREANKILKNNIIGGYFSDGEPSKEKQKGLNRTACFFLGALLSFALSTLMFLLIK